MNRVGLILETEMSRARYRALEVNPEEKLTSEEKAAGWHFCNSEWDGMLIHKSFPEYEVCSCDGKL